MPKLGKAFADLTSYPEPEPERATRLMQAHFASGLEAAA